MEEYIETMTEYFSKYKSNNQYYVAIKHHVAMYLLRKGYRVEDCRRVINVNHASVIHYRDNFKQHHWAEKFITENLGRYVAESIYPYSGKQQKLRERKIERSPGIKLEKQSRPYADRNKAFHISQKYVDICEVFGMNKKTREHIMLSNRNYLILYLQLTYNTPEKHLCSLFGITHPALFNASQQVRQQIADVDSKFYRHNEYLRYILHGDTRTGKIFLWSKGKGKPPGSDES